MKFLFKLAVVSGIAYLTVRLLESQQASGAGRATSKRSAGGFADAAQDADVVMGISDVDPVPLSGMGEAIDPEANADAHNEMKQQRGRMPARGKNMI